MSEIGGIFGLCAHERVEGVLHRGEELELEEGGPFGRVDPLHARVLKKRLFYNKV